MLYLSMQYGLLMVTVTFLLWQGRLRETRTTERLSKLEDNHKSVLLPKVEVPLATRRRRPRSLTARLKASPSSN